MVAGAVAEKLLLNNNIFQRGKRMKTGFGRMMCMALCTMAIGIFFSVDAQAATKEEDNANVKAAKSRCIKDVEDAYEYLKIAKGAKFNRTQPK